MAKSNVAKNKILEAMNGIVAILDGLVPDERQRALEAALTVLDDGSQPATSLRSVAPSGGATSSTAATARPAAMTAKAYFDAKKPKGKSEEFAVAARYREEYQQATGTTREQMQEVIQEARRDFTAKNYGRDVDNARTSGYFNRGTGKEAVLSHYGQNYVDALPDREAAKATAQARTRRTGKKKKAASKRVAR